MAQRVEQSPAPPPAYSLENPKQDICGRSGAPTQAGQPPRLKPWQSRWNMEWVDEALIPDLRKGWAWAERNRHRTGSSKAFVRDGRARAEAWVSEGIRKGCTSEKNTLSRSRWQRVTDRLFGRLKAEIDDFVEWRRDWKNEDKKCKVTAVMEEVGDSPRWQAEMTFALSQEHWDELQGANQWFEFPSAENIKWLWVTRPDGYPRLYSPAEEHWGPVENGRFPFWVRDGRVVRNAQLTIANFNGYQASFTEPTRRCRHCDVESQRTE